MAWGCKCDGRQADNAADAESCILIDSVPSLQLFLSDQRFPDSLYATRLTCRCPFRNCHPEAKPCKRYGPSRGRDKIPLYNLLRVSSTSQQPGRVVGGRRAVRWVPGLSGGGGEAGLAAFVSLCVGGGSGGNMTENIYLQERGLFGIMGRCHSRTNSSSRPITVCRQ